MVVIISNTTFCKGIHNSTHAYCSSLYNFQKAIENLSLHIVLSIKHYTQDVHNCIRLLYKHARLLNFITLVENLAVL